MKKSFYSKKINKKTVFCALAVIFAVLTVMCDAFILYNGTRKSEKSWTISNAVTDRVEPIVNPSGSIGQRDFKNMVRKYAHFIEYFMLGLNAGLSALFLKLYGKKLRFFEAVCLILATALADEYLQTLINRSGMVSDQIIDFVGGIIGLSIALIPILIILLVKFYKKSKI